MEQKEVRELQWRTAPPSFCSPHITEWSNFSSADQGYLRKSPLPSRGMLVAFKVLGAGFLVTVSPYRREGVARNMSKFRTKLQTFFVR
jgi:hypothetical protein